MNAGDTYQVIQFCENQNMSELISLITCADAVYIDHLPSFNTHMYTCLRFKCPLLKYLEKINTSLGS